MKNRRIEINLEALSLEELTPEQQELVTTAICATDNSYSPHSHFCVGAAVRLQNGMIVRGANQENAAFSVTICAERSAIFAAQANYPDQPITTIAVAARNIDGNLLADPVSPCGSCRQVMTEIEDRYKNDMIVLLYGTRCIYRFKTAKDLLPLCFVDANMR